MAPNPHLDRRPTVARRLPLPASAPPFDDELPRDDTVVGIRRDEHPWARHAVVPPTQGALALSFSLPGGVPAEPEASSELRLLTAAAPTEALPDPTRWTARLAQAIVESLYGPRPIQQLLRWTDDRVYRGLAQLAAGRPPGSRHLAPQLRAVRVCRVADRIAEATVVVQIGPRCRSLALRLIAEESRWVCVSFDLV